MSRDDEIIDEYYIEDVWKCSSCGAECLGHELRCKQCGSPKEKNETYKTGDVNKRLTNATKLKEAVAGPNRTCPFCKSDNRIFEGSCLECGAKVEEQAPKPTQPRSGAPRAQGPFTRPTAPAVPKQAVFRRSGSGVTVATIVGLAAVVVFWGGYTLFATHRITVSVSKTSWSVAKVLEQRSTQHGSGWGSPFGAFNASCESRLHGYERCHAHDCDPYQQSYECRPHKCNCSTYTTTSSGRNGYSKISVHRSCDTCYDTCSRTSYHTCYDRCPDYEQWCEYDFYEWSVVDRRSSEGTTCEVTEPTVEAGALQRVSQHDSYSIQFTDHKKTWDFTPNDRADYQRYCANPLWEADISRLTFTPVRPR
jgi:hypothetical protein